nr:PHP domain-containing protein [Desulforamulus aquiferis]
MVIDLLTDLHIHTTASDGSDTPGEVVSRALRLGLKAIAISDHDTMEGIIPAQQAANGFNLEVLSGVEVNTYQKGNEIHVLGYLINPNNDEFISKLRELQGDRLDRIKKMLCKLKALNIFLELDRILEFSKGGSVGRPHVARAMQEKGYVSSAQEAFSKYIGAEKPAYIPREKLTPREAVELILRSGGVPVLAHPGLLKDSGPIIKSLLEVGLKGLEVWHLKHSPLMVQYYLEKAKKYNLVPTGGSDYHGTGHEACNTLELLGHPTSLYRD